MKRSENSRVCLSLSLLPPYSPLFLFTASPAGSTLTHIRSSDISRITLKCAKATEVCGIWIFRDSYFHHMSHFFQQVSSVTLPIYAKDFKQCRMTNSDDSSNSCEKRGLPFKSNKCGQTAGRRHRCVCVVCTGGRGLQSFGTRWFWANQKAVCMQGDSVFTLSLKKSACGFWRYLNLRVEILH